MRHVKPPAATLAVTDTMRDIKPPAATLAVTDTMRHIKPPAATLADHTYIFLATLGDVPPQWVYLLLVPYGSASMQRATVAMHITFPAFAQMARSANSRRAGHQSVPTTTGVTWSCVIPLVVAIRYNNALALALTL